MRGLGHVVSEKKIFLCFAPSRPRGRACMDPRGTSGVSGVRIPSHVFLKTVVRLYECHEGFALLIGQNFTATDLRHSHKPRPPVTQQPRESCFGEKNFKKNLNMFKTFAVSLRHMKILATLVRHSHICSAKGPRLNSQNSHKKFAYK